MMIRRYIPLCLILLLVCCSKPDLAPTEDAPVMLSLDTKALPDGEHTYRVGLFHGATNAFLAQGTYCSLYVDHTATSGQWLSPCKVNSDGDALKTDGTVAASLAEADTSKSYGLRYYSDSGLYSYLVAMSPARNFAVDGSLRYYNWIPGDAVYVSEGAFAYFRGSFFNGQFIYEASNTNTNNPLRLKDRRSKVDIHIECDKLPKAYIQKVILNNCVRNARWYFPGGFLASDTHYGTQNVVVRDFATPRELVKANGDYWWSKEDSDATTVYIPSIDFSNDDFATLRPQIEIWLGSEPPKHFTAKVDITEKFEPMMDYTYNLVVSKSTVEITLTAKPWDTLPGDINTQSETPAKIGTVTIEGWETVTDTADDWATTI